MKRILLANFAPEMNAYTQGLFSTLAPDHYLYFHDGQIQPYGVEYCYPQTANLTSQKLAINSPLVQIVQVDRFKILIINQLGDLHHIPLVRAVNLAHDYDCQIVVARSKNQVFQMHEGVIVIGMQVLESPGLMNLNTSILIQLNEANNYWSVMFLAHKVLSPYTGVVVTQILKKIANSNAKWTRQLVTDQFADFNIPAIDKPLRKPKYFVLGSYLDDSVDLANEPWVELTDENEEEQWEDDNDEDEDLDMNEAWISEVDEDTTTEADAGLIDAQVQADGVDFNQTEVDPDESFESVDLDSAVEVAAPLAVEEETQELEAAVEEAQPPVDDQSFSDHSVSESNYDDQDDQDQDHWAKAFYQPADSSTNQTQPNETTEPNPAVHEQTLGDHNQSQSPFAQATTANVPEVDHTAELAAREQLISQLNLAFNFATEIIVRFSQLAKRTPEYYQKTDAWTHYHQNKVFAWKAIIDPYLSVTDANQQLVFANQYLEKILACLNNFMSTFLAHTHSLILHLMEQAQVDAHNYQRPVDLQDYQQLLDTVSAEQQRFFNDQLAASANLVA